VTGELLEQAVYVNLGAKPACQQIHAPNLAMDKQCIDGGYRPEVSAKPVAQRAIPRPTRQVRRFKIKDWTSHDIVHAHAHKIKYQLRQPMLVRLEIANIEHGTELLGFVSGERRNQ
jgi:hypothetical protein